jgi:hypothetical protein
MYPNFLIIGAQKSASTFVHECVREHPDVFMPRDEVAYFQDPDYLESSLASFKSLFAPVKAEKAIGIKCPDYLSRPECPERISLHIPEAKLIVVLRNPVERAISAYYWYIQVGIIPARPLNEGMLDLINGAYDRLFPRAKEIIKYGFYHENLQNYLRFFKREQILILMQTDIKASPRKFVSQIYRFLDVDDGYVPKALERQPKQAVYSIARLKWLSMANRLFFYDYRVDANNMMSLYPVENRFYRLCYYIFLGVDRYFLSFVFRNDREKLTEDLRKSLVGIYRDDIEALEKYLGQELTNWK